MTGIIKNKETSTLIPKKLLTDYWARNVNSAIAELGRAFYEARQKGLSQDALALRLGVSKSRISKILRGHSKNLTLKTLSEMSLAIGCDLQIKLLDPKHLINQRKNYHYTLNDFPAFTPTFSSGAAHVPSSIR